MKCWSLDKWLVDHHIIDCTLNWQLSIALSYNLLSTGICTICKQITNVNRKERFLIPTLIWDQENFANILTECFSHHQGQLRSNHFKITNVWKKWLPTTLRCLKLSCKYILNKFPLDRLDYTALGWHHVPCTEEEEETKHFGLVLLWCFFTPLRACYSSWKHSKMMVGCYIGL